MTPNPMLAERPFLRNKCFFEESPLNSRTTSTDSECVVARKVYELQNRKSDSNFQNNKRLSANVRAWRRGDIPCYVSRDMLLIKDMKLKIYSIAGLYSSD